MDKFIVVAGNIGVGKSSLVALLSEHLEWQPFYEPVSDNPYLVDFYKDMRAWAFHSQIYFLTRRLHIHHQLLRAGGCVIQDRSVYEDAEIFAQNLFLQGSITQRDFATYLDLYRVLCAFLPPPNLVIYLKASVPTLQKRIKQRGRDYEKSISPKYLAQLNALYEQWISNFNRSPVLTIPCDDLDFVASPAHLDMVIEKINTMLTGKDPVSFSASY